MKETYILILVRAAGILFLGLFLILDIASIILIDYPYKFFSIFIFIFFILFLYCYIYIYFYMQKNNIKNIVDISDKILIEDYKKAISGLKEKNSYVLGRYNALDSIRVKYKKDMDKARKLQGNLIPKKLPFGKYISSAFFYKPAETIGGDFFDYNFKNESRFLFMISDISGHGVEAAMITSMLKTTFHNFVSQEFSVGNILQSMNNYLINILPNNYYLTAILADIDLKNKKIIYASASHTSFFLKRGDETIEYDKSGTILGLFPNAVYEEYEIDLKKDDYILFYTDGIIEASRSRNKYDLYGKDRLKKIFSNFIFDSADSVLDTIKKDFYEYLSYRAPDDVCTMIVFNIK